MKNYVEIVCKDEHTYKLLNEFVKNKGYRTLSMKHNTIFALTEDFEKAEKCFDEVARVIDMYSDLKVLEMEIKDLI